MSEEDRLDGIIGRFISGSDSVRNAFVAEIRNELRRFAAAPEGRYSAEEKRREALREVGMRKTVYARTGVNPSEAKLRIEIMQEIADDYEKLAQKERLL